MDRTDRQGRRDRGGCPADTPSRQHHNYCLFNDNVSTAEDI